MSYHALRYAFLILLSAGFVIAAWALGRVSLLLGFAVVPIALLALIIAARVLRLDTVHRTRQEVLAILQSFLDTPDAGYNPRWDDFVSVPIQDPELDAVRRRLLQLEDRHSRTAAEEFLRAWKQEVREALRQLDAPAA